MPEPLRIGLVALNAYPAIDPEADGPIGGIETRAWLFARGLAQLPENEVCCVVRRDRPAAREQVDNVRIVTLVDRLYRTRESVRLCVGRKETFPWLTLHRWKASLLWQFPLVAGARLLRGRPGDPWQADPRLEQLPIDIDCTFGVQSHSATVIASAHAACRPVVLMLGSDGDLDERYVAGSTFISPYGDQGGVCYDILQRADVIVAQTESQQRILRSRFGRDSTVIANPIDVDDWDARHAQPAPVELTAGLSRYVLWVGRAESVHKRPLVCLELARMCPEIDFLMIMNPRDPAVAEQVRREAPANVKIVPRVAFSEMPGVFARAAALVNTSSLEGFPNVFLQAAISRVPIASLNVGREFLSDIGAGCDADGDMQRMAGSLRAAWSKSEALDDEVSLARGRVISQHGLPQQAEKLAALLRDVKAGTWSPDAQGAAP